MVFIESFYRDVFSDKDEESNHKLACNTYFPTRIPHQHDDESRTLEDSKSLIEGEAR